MFPLTTVDMASRFSHIELGNFLRSLEPNITSMKTTGMPKYLFFWMLWGDYVTIIFTDELNCNPFCV